MSNYWANLIAWSLQVTIVAAAGASLPSLFRLHACRARLWYWHLLLVACLALPLVEPWAKPAPSRSSVTIGTGQFNVVGSHAPAGFTISWPAVAMAILCGGIVLRLVWLGAGLVRLRRYRATAVLLDPADDGFGDLRRTLAPEAEMLLSGRVTSPVTFGLQNAVILLPERFRDLGIEERRSIICHELIHIRRRDWAVAIAEELVRSFLWFHPAIWWLLGRIQLTREQVVDEAVIERTGDRKRYLDALVAIASLQLRADLAPAPLFLKKRHLRQRVESIVSGVNMTKRNLLFPLAAAFATLPVVIGIAAWQFPLRAGPQEGIDDPGVEVQLGSMKVLHRTGIAYPDQARANHVSGTVVANVTVDDKGEVSDVHADAPGLAPLSRSVTASVMQWHFDLDSSSPRSFDISVYFDASKASESPQKAASMLVPPNSEDIPRPIANYLCQGLETELCDKVRGSGLLHTGAVVTSTDLKSIETSLREIDDHLRLTALVDGDKIHVIVNLFTPRTASQPTVIRVGGNVQAANLIHKVTPVYPPDAKAARVQGTVKLSVTIGTDGTVQNIEVVSGDPMLVSAALPAVKDWVYKPTLLNGKPVEVLTVVDVNFTLTQ